MGMQHDEIHTELLKRELLKAMRDEGLIESFLPIVYKNTSDPPLKALVLKLMDANKRHQVILDTAILSTSSIGPEEEVEDSTISHLIKGIHAKEASGQQEARFVATLQKILYQQAANFKILHSFIPAFELQQLSEDFRHVVEEATGSFEELQKVWTLSLASASH